MSDWETEIHRESEELRNQEDEEEEPDWEPENIFKVSIPPLPINFEPYRIHSLLSLTKRGNGTFFVTAVLRK